MTADEIMNLSDKYIVHTYNRYPVVPVRGDGVRLYDKNGKQYLDFAAGIGVFALGYGNRAYNDALKDQIDKIIHTSNLFYNEHAGSAAEKLAKATGLEKVFFTNSGTEAVEGAIKMARRYAFDRDHTADHEIIAMQNSFHGRTLGALAVTGNERYRKPFGPMPEGVKFARFNDLDSVKALVSDKTCAVILEAVQGEGGIYPATAEFMRGIRELCDENDIIMICDEIQCGMGRTGKMFAYEHYGILPDIVTAAKALGCGIPVGAFAAGKKVCESLVPGDHGTTYGGNPLATAAVSKVFEIFDSENIPARVRETGAYLEKRLDETVKDFPDVIERRGTGLMQGLELAGPAADVINRAMNNGLIVISAGANVLRFLPPLIITESHIDEMIGILRAAL